MFSLMKAYPLKTFLSVQAPSLVASLAIAELFYKFGSFLLEAIAFLVTWFVVDALLSLILKSTPKAADSKPAGTD